MKLRSISFPIRFFTIAGAGMALAVSAFAQAVIEDFSYPNGLLVGQGGGSGWSGPWRNAFPPANSPNATVNGGRLTVTSATNDQVFRNVNAVLWPTNGSSAYLSFTIRMEVAGSTGSFITATPNTPNEFGATGQWGVDFFGGMLRIAGQSMGVANPLIVGTDYQFVLRLTRNDVGVGDESLTLWVNPTSEASPPLLTAFQNALDNNGGSTVASPTALVIAPTDSGAFTYDRIRMGTSFGQVIPEPGAGAIALAGALATAGIWRWRRGRAAIHG